MSTEELLVLLYYSSLRGIRRLTALTLYFKFRHYRTGCQESAPSEIHLPLSFMSVSRDEAQVGRLGCGCGALLGCQVDNDYYYARSKNEYIFRDSQGNGRVLLGLRR